VPFVEWFQLDLDAYFKAEEKQSTVFCLSCAWRGTMVESAGSDTCPACDGPLAGFTWIPDLVYVRPDEVEIVDWKTYYKGLTEKQARSEFQLKFYLWQAMHLWPGFAKYTFTFNFVRLRYAISITLSAEEIEAFSDEVKGILLSIHEAQRTENFPAIPGSHCTLCRLNCPVADNRYRLPVRIVTEAERDAAAGRLLALEPELRALKKILKGYCDREGGFIYNGQAFGFWASSSRTYPADAVLTWLKDAGYNVDGITLSASALGDLAKPKKSRPDVLQMLEGLKIERAGWTFRHRREGESLPEGLRDLLADTEGEDNADDE
jgi:hypothetical protein